MTRLRVGDKLTVVKAGQITVQLTSAREVWSLPAEGSFLVEHKALKSLTKFQPKLVRRIAAPKKSQPAPNSQYMAGVIRGKGVVIRPFGAVTNSPVSLSWTKVPGTQRTTVFVRGPQNKILQPERDLGAANSVTLDAKATPVGVWVQVEIKQVNASPSSTVISRTHLRVMPSSEVQQVADEEKALFSALQSDPVALVMALGELWAGFGMASKLEEAAKLAYPTDDAGARFQLAVWLEQCGFAGRARSEYERAWSLGNRDADLKVAIERLGGKAEIPEWENLAAERDLLMQEEKWQEALPLARKVVDIFRKEKPGSFELAYALDTLARTSYFLSDLKDSQMAFASALAIYEKLAPGTHGVADSLAILGIITSDLGDLEVAQQYHEAALAIREKLSPDSNDVANSLNSLAGVVAERGDFEKAQTLAEGALAIREKLFPGSLTVAASLNNLGVVIYNRGDLEGAQRRYEAALAIREKLAPGSLPVAGSLTSLGIVAHDRGDFEEAMRRHEAALAIYEKFAPESLAMAASLTNLGVVAHSRGNWEVAERRHEAALAIHEKLAPGSLGMAMSLNNLGLVARERGDLELAQRRHEAGLAIEQKLAPGSINAAMSLNNLGLVAQSRNDFEAAQRHQEGALAIYEKLAPFSRGTATILQNLGTVLLARGDEVQHLALHQRRLALAATLIRQQGAAMAGDLGAFGQAATEALEQSGWLGDPSTIYAFLPTLRGAGLTMESRVAAARRRAAGDEDVRQAFAAVQIAAKAESDWSTKPRPEGMDEQAWTNELLDRRSKKQSAEAAMSHLLKEKDPRLADELTIEIPAIQQALGKDEILIEFLRISTWDKTAKKQGPAAYGAFLVRSEGDVRFVRLGEAAEIDELVRTWHEAIARSNAPGATDQDLKGTEKQLKETGRQLYDRLVKPLGKLPETLLIAPDSELHSLPFAALHDGRKYLVEARAVAVVGSGRDLVERPPSAAAGEAVVFAAPQFDLTVAASSENAAVRSSTRSFNATGTWDMLPGAAAEGRAVADGLNAVLIEGVDATEEKLLAVRNPSVLHIATHGFFFPPIQDRDDRESRQTMEVGRGVRVADSPMIRTGLILAGANRDQELMRAGLADGWATALELSQMDLRGTELVVLSACETGRGDTRGAEGVFGLQRAFRFAGAQSLLMSLFKVPDEVPAGSTGLMERFYGGWKPGDPGGTKLKALREAQHAMLKDSKTRHPRYWSAFVLMGAR